MSLDHYGGYFADTGISFVVGTPDEKKQQLCDVAKSAFDRAMLKVKAGSSLNQIGKAVEREAKDHGLQLLKTYWSRYREIVARRTSTYT